MTEMDLVVIVWRDAHAYSSTWQTIDEACDGGDYQVSSCGWRLPDEHTKRGHVSITQSITSDDYLDCVLHIPEEMVIYEQRIEGITNDTLPVHRDSEGRISADRLPATRRRPRSRRRA